MRTSADRVYLDAEAAADAVATALRRAVAQGQRAALVTPFRAHVATVSDRLARRGVLTAPVERSMRDAAPPDAVPIADYATLPRLLADLAPPLLLLQVERHPLRVHDVAVEQALAAHSPGNTLQVFLSLDDGLLAIFGGATRELMAKLGLAPGEPIEHSFVTAAIENAQTKLAKKAAHEVAADSFEEWRARNLDR